MTVLTFIATLESDTVISETSATVGTHASLDYLPGACFLGACALRLYSTLSQEDAFTTFHSGLVRFGNAYPLTSSGLPTLPAPSSWHYFKGETPFIDGKLNGAAIMDLTRTDDAKLDSGKQPKQIRETYITQCGAVVEKSSSYRLKSAIDRSTKRSAEAQLFGYESLRAGSRWWFTVECDATIGQQLRDKIISSLVGSVRIGRSRTAEYGQARISHEKSVAFSPTLSNTESQSLFIYCMSDLALRDKSSGAPTQIPCADHFHLPVDTRITGDKCFIRVRTYAPFNGKRRANDIERQVICKGSVITFEKASGALFSTDEIGTLRKKLASGVGMHRYDGLGKVLLNPAFLVDTEVASLSSEPLVLPKQQSPKQLPAKTSELISWLESRFNKNDAQGSISAQVEAWAAILVKATSDADATCPGNSQWGAVRNIASTPGTTIEKLRQGLFAPEAGICVHGVSQAQWGVEFRYGKTWTSFVCFLRDVVLTHSTDCEQVRAALYLLAERMPKKLNQLKGGK